MKASKFCFRKPESEGAERTADPVAGEKPDDALFACTEFMALVCMRRFRKCIVRASENEAWEIQ